MVDLPSWVYTTGWVVWVLGFAVLETLALLDTDYGDTLTEHVRPLVHQNAVLGWLMIVGLAWLAIHIVVQGR